MMENPDQYYKALCSSETIYSGTNGFFRIFKQSVSKKTGNTWIVNIFGKMKTDRDRIRIVLTDPTVKTIVIEALSKIKHVYHDKDAHISREKRLAAYERAGCGEIVNAQLYFSQAIIRSPPTGQVPSVDRGFSLPLALIGRANVFMMLKKYELALNDFEMAAKENLPLNIRDQLDRKMGNCKELWQQSETGKASFTNSVNVFRGENGSPTRDDYLKLQPPRLTDGPHSSLPELSKLVQLRESQLFGVHAVAASEIRVGDTLAIESPVASCLLPVHFGTHCHNCLMRLEAPIGCSSCSSVAFCSEKCRDTAAQSYHKYECKILGLLVGSGMSILSFLALRMVTQSGIESCGLLCDRFDIPGPLNEINKKSSGMEQHVNLEEKRPDEINCQLECSTVDARPYQLVTHDSHRSAADYFERTLMAVFLLECLRKVDFFMNSSNSTDLPNHEELDVGAILLRNLKLLQFNAHEITERRRQNDHQFCSSTTIHLGIGIYPSIARFNHDCYPGVTRYFSGRDVIIQAIRPFKSGEVIAENYGPIFTRKTLKERRRTLEGRYWFRCSCRACDEDWPDLNNLPKNPTRVRCTTSRCKGLAIVASAGPVKCSVCQKTIDVNECLNNLKSCEERYTRGLAMMNNGELQKAVKELALAVETFHSIASPPYKQTHLAETALATCLANSLGSSNVHRK